MLTRLRADRLGMMFQAPLLLDAQTVRENIMMGLRNSASWPGQGAGDLAGESAAKLGVVALLDRPAVSLSGGEKQRVSLCAGHDPEA